MRTMRWWGIVAALCLAVSGCDAAADMQNAGGDEPPMQASIGPLPSGAELECHDITEDLCEEQARHVLVAPGQDLGTITRIVVTCVTGCPDQSPNTGRVVVHGAEAFTFWWQAGE
jgi:hypothetical protein